MLTTLTSFSTVDVAIPSVALVQGPDGYFYGTSVAGGPDMAGTIFMVTPSGDVTIAFSLSIPVCLLLMKVWFREMMAILWHDLLWWREWLRHSFQNNTLRNPNNFVFV